MIMRMVGFFFLITGWIIVLSAIALLQATLQSAFVFAGFAVQLAGLIIVVRAHMIPRGDKA
jgi:hypothetical protein